MDEASNDSIKQRRLVYRRLVRALGRNVEQLRPIVCRYLEAFVDSKIAGERLNSQIAERMGISREAYWKFHQRYPWAERWCYQFIRVMRETFAAQIQAPELSPVLLRRAALADLVGSQIDGGLTKSETVCVEGLKRLGLVVLRRGWPDFLVVDPASLTLMALEVKSQTDRVSKEQAAMHAVLSAAGIRVVVLQYQGADLNTADADQCATLVADNLRKLFQPLGVVPQP